MPNYGDNDHPTDDLVPDWLMGGNRKRRVLAALAQPPPRGGWTVQELIDEIECGRSTAYEIVRGLRALGALEKSSDGRMRLARAPLGKAIKHMIKALEPYAAVPVDRPPRPRSTTRRVNDDS